MTISASSFDGDDIGVGLICENQKEESHFMVHGSKCHHPR
jgi:hypothetical protein